MGMGLQDPQNGGFLLESIRTFPLRFVGTRFNSQAWDMAASSISFTNHHQPIPTEAYQCDARRCTQGELSAPESHDDKIH